MDEEKRTFYDKISQPKMLTSLVASTVTYAIAKGISMEKIHNLTGLTSKDLIDNDSYLSQEILPTIWRILSKANPGKVLTLEMAKATPFSYFGTLAYGAKYAENLRNALESLIRYRFVMSEKLQLNLVESLSKTELKIYHPMDEKDGGCGAEVGFALGSRFMREILGVEDIFESINFTHKPFGKIEIYEEFFGTKVRFQQSYNAFVFHQGALDLNTKQGDKDLFRYIEGHLDLVSKRLIIPNESSEIIKIKEAIAYNAKRSQYSADALAKKMNMSLRTLQRITHNYKTTIRQLLDETRQANAKEFLSDSKLTIGEISFLLGYSEERSFRRAFKRWTNLSPAKFRRQNYGF